MSPTKRTVSRATSGRQNAESIAMNGGSGIFSISTSAPVSTWTPGSDAASETSIEVIVAWAIGERRKVTRNAFSIGTLST